MVKAILLTADPNLHVKPVTARVGTADRATPSPTSSKPAKSTSTAASPSWKRSFAA